MKYPCLLTKSIKELSPAKYNPRKITDEAMGRLTKSLAEFGNIQPITWNARTGNVVGGHQRLKVYQAMGKTEVEVWAVDLDEQKEKAANIALNKLSGEFDLPMLKDILEEIDTGELDLEITGFGMDEIALMMEDAHPEVTEDEVPEVPVDAITKLGDLWILGEHRVLCGDSTSDADVSRLMNGEKAEMMFTDPPYGVDYSGGIQFNKNGEAKTNNREKLKNDNSTQIYYDFLPVAISATDGPCYMWFADSKARDVYNALYDNKCEIHALIIWHKTNATYAAMNAQYKQRHEPCLYFKPKGSTLRWCGETTEATIWNQDRDGINDLHPTQKPVALASKAIRNHESKSVLDLFCGSGSTLIAAEQLGRKCYGMEISPNYCDVIVKRWENLTGKKATLANE
jgi:DNA modification methylase